jgi:hypothetical protein
VNGTLLVFLIAAASGTAAVPRFAAPFILQVTSHYLATDLIASPFFVDWNEDGMSDIIVDWASVPEGKGRIYHYHWLTPHPVPISYMPLDMECSVKLQDASNYLTIGLIANPFWGDWNGDGTNDLIVGQLLEGRVRFYQNYGTNQDPVFISYEFLQADGAEITAPYS